MTGLSALVKRNTKLYFKDKGMFISSLITPIILLVLYSTFLKKVYDDSFRSALKAAGATTVKAVIVNGDEKKISAALKATDECAVKCDLPCDKAVKTEKKDDLREAKFTAAARMYCDLPTYLL